METYKEKLERLYNERDTLKPYTEEWLIINDQIDDLIEFKRESITDNS